MKRTLILCLVSCVTVIAGGCACGPWFIPPPKICDSSAGYLATHESGCDDCGQAGGGQCGQPCETACGQCAEVSAAACGPPCGPLTWLFTILSYGYQGQGCGEIWWGDWHGAPPDCNDPCDRNGEYTGRGSSGCDSCAGGGRQVAPPRVIVGGGHTGGETPGCKSCAGGGRQVSAPRVATARPKGNMTGRRVPAKSAHGYITDASSKYAPRLMSTTDKVVDTKRPGSVPQAALPRRMPAHR